VGRTPLHDAAGNGNDQTVGLLIAAGADVNAKTSKGITALSLTKEKGHKEVVEFLLKHGAKE
jgi:ankyrin repeat protein